MSDEMDLLAQDLADGGDGSNRTVNGTIVDRDGGVVTVDIGGATLAAYSPPAAGLVVGNTVQVKVQEGTASVSSVIDGPMGSVPVGAVMMWAGTAAPAGWLLLNGATFSSTDYPDLYAALGNSAVLPNMTDRFPIGAGTKTIKSTGGSATHTMTVGELASHNHNLVHTHTTGMGIGTIREGTAASTPSIMYPTAGGTSTGGASTAITSNNGDGDPMNILNPYLTLNFIIYAGAIAA